MELKRWTPSEDKELMDLVAKSKSKSAAFKKAVKILKKTKSSVTNRYYALVKVVTEPLHPTPVVEPVQRKSAAKDIAGLKFDAGFAKVIVTDVQLVITITDENYTLIVDGKKILISV